MRQLRTKNSFNLFFLVLVGLSLWLGGDFFYRLNHYFKLSAKTSATISSWRVVEMKKDHFLVAASYTAYVDDQTFMGDFLFPEPVFQNPYLAEDLIEEWQDKRWCIWYPKGSPECASMVRSFPLKKAFYFSLSLFSLLYFALLNLYVKRRHSPQEASERAL